MSYYLGNENEDSCASNFVLGYKNKKSLILLQNEVIQIKKEMNDIKELLKEMNSTIFEYTNMIKYHPDFGGEDIKKSNEEFNESLKKNQMKKKKNIKDKCFSKNFI